MWAENQYFLSQNFAMISTTMRRNCVTLSGEEHPIKKRIIERKIEMVRGKQKTSPKD